MDLNGMNSPASKAQQRNNHGINNVPVIKPSSSSSSINNKVQQSLTSPFDALSAFGNDLNSAVAALSAASGGNLDSSALAQINALAQLNQIATNQKFAAMLQLQQQQQHIQSVLNNTQSSSLTQLNNSNLTALQTIGSHQQANQHQQGSNTFNSYSSFTGSNNNTVRMNQSRYQQLLTVVDEMGREIRNTYLGNKNSIERLKRAIASARILVKDCQIECDKGFQQTSKLI
jgi:hypothetical protein